MRIGENWLRDDGYVSHQGTVVRIYDSDHANPGFEPAPVIGFAAAAAPAVMDPPDTVVADPPEAEPETVPLWNPDDGDYG